MFRLALALTLIVAALDWFIASALAQPQQWGDLQGQIVFKGPAHPQRPLNVANNPDVRICKQDKGLVEEDWIINKENKGVKNVMVWIRPAGIAKNAAFPKNLIHPNLVKPEKDTVEIDIPCCRFVPHMLAAREGQKFVIKNSSLANHNPKFESANSGSFNPIITAGESVKLPKPLVAERGAIVLQCSIHPWMNAYMRVFDHPYFAITDENGKFEIKDAPVGNFDIWYWHPDQGWLGGKDGRNGYPIVIKQGKNDLGKKELDGPAKLGPVMNWRVPNVPAPDPNLPRGMLKGQVVWKGEIPARKPIDFGNHPDKEACAKDKDLVDEDWIINPKNNGVKDVVVWISPGKPFDSFPTNLIHPRLETPAKEAVVLNVDGCRFEPHVLVARQGQHLIVANSSSISHRFDWYSLKNRRPDAIVFGNDLVLKYLLADSWPIAVKCGIHPWMKAHVRVFDHPYFAVTNADGKFAIPDAPAGSMRIYYWHPVSGSLGGEKGFALEIKVGDNSLGAKEMTKK